MCSKNIFKLFKILFYDLCVKIKRENLADLWLWLSRAEAKMKPCDDLKIDTICKICGIQKMTGPERPATLKLFIYLTLLKYESLTRKYRELF